MESEMGLLLFKTISEPRLLCSDFFFYFRQEAFGEMKFQENEMDLDLVFTRLDV